MALEASLGSIQTEFRNEIAVLQFNTSLIIAELRRMNKRMDGRSSGTKRKRRVVIGSDSESDSDNNDIAIETSTDTEDSNESEESIPQAVPRIRQRRSKRTRGKASSPLLIPDREDSSDLDHAVISGSIRFHREDGPYITGIVESTEDVKSPVARIRWLKPLKSGSKCNVFVYCDWPPQQVPLVNSHALSAVPVISDARQMHWDHLTYNKGAAANGFPDAPFEVLPYYYEYATGTTVDFTKVFHFMIDSTVHTQSSIRDKTDYKVNLLHLLLDCYGSPSSLLDFGTRTEADAESNLELARMASDVSAKRFRHHCKHVKNPVKDLCDCCNKRCLIVSNFMNLGMCGTCQCRFSKLVKLTDSMKIPDPTTLPLKNSVLDRFSSLMYSFSEII